MAKFEEITIKNKKKKISLNVRKLNRIDRFIGLMFKRRNSPALLFEFGKETRISIHSFFVFFPFLAIWLDNENNITEKRIIKPFYPSIKPKKEFKKLIEIPLTSIPKEKMILLVGKKRFKYSFD